MGLLTAAVAFRLEIEAEACLWDGDILAQCKMLVTSTKLR